MDSVVDPQSPIAGLSLPTPGEREQLLVTWNTTQRDYPRDKCVHHLFEEQVERTPDACAVVFAQQHISYRELNRRANQLAHDLQRSGVGPNMLVGICIECSLDMVIGILGILKAGGAYVPLDPTYPYERLAFMLADSELTLLITQQRLTEVPPTHKAHVIYLDADDKFIAQESEKNPTSGVTYQDLAYVIYTSGSTGRPKGVLVEHRGLGNMVEAQIRTFSVQSHSRVLQFASLSFDASVSEIFMAWLAGAQLYLIPSDLRWPAPVLHKFLREYAITTITLPPAVLAVLSSGGLPDLQTVISAAEELSSNIVEHWSAGRHLFNAYGPTESTVCTTISVCTNGSRKPTIGRPLANTQVYLLDASLQPVPIGMPAQMYIGGAGLARGYLNRPELTAEKFIPNPFSTEPGARLYKTGDVARYLPDGSIDYIGRIDRMAKVRGFRIELGEIEAILEQHPGISKAVVLLHEDHHHDKRLIAYAIPRPDYQNSEKLLAAWYAESHISPKISADLHMTRSPVVTNLSSGEEKRLQAKQISEFLLSFLPQHILEIGCGEGQLVSLLAPACTHYWATDVSPAALHSIEQQLPEHIASRVTLLHRMAHDFTGMGGDGLVNRAPMRNHAPAFDVVVLNDVVRRFPGIHYLMHVLESALQVIRPGGVIFVRNVGSLPLCEAYHTFFKMREEPDSLSREQLRHRIYKNVAEEERLLIDPAFFVSLSRHFLQIRHVQLLLRREYHVGSIARFHYDVLIRTNSASQGESFDDATVYQIDWEEKQFAVAAIRQLLIEEAPGKLSIRRIPHTQLLKDQWAVELLKGDQRYRTVGEMWEAVRALEPAGIVPEALWSLGEELGYSIEISLDDAGSEKRYNALFKRNNKNTTFAMIYENDQNATTSSLHPFSHYANTPLRGKVMQFLKERLPKYMVPSAFLLLDTLPLTSNRKIDRSMLPVPDWIHPTGKEE